MAKKKKFNRRILVLLPIALLVVAAVVIAVILARLPGNPAVDFTKAQAAFDKGDYREAQRWAGKAVADITKSAKSEPDSPQVAEYLYKAALLNLRIATEGKPPITQQERSEAAGAAIGLFRKTVLRDPRHADAQKKLCDLASDAAELITESEKYLKIKPDDDEMIFRHAMANVMIYRRMGGGEWDKRALEDFNRLLAMKPDKLEYWKQKALLLWEKKDRDGAVDVMKQAVDKNPGSADFCVAYASFLQNDEAIKATKPKKGEKLPSQFWYEEAIRRQPENIIGYLALAQVRAGDQQFNEAIALLKTAAQKDPCDFRSYEAAALVYERNADKNNAIKILKTGLATITDQLSKGTVSPQSAPVATSAPAGTVKAATDKNRMEYGQFSLTAKLAYVILGLASSPDQADNRQALLKEAADLGVDLNKQKTNCPESSKVLGGVALFTADSATSEQARREAYEKAANLLEEATTRFAEANRGLEIQTASWLTKCYLELGRRGDAEKLLENIRKVDQKDIRPLMDLARLSIGSGDFNRAKEFVITILAVEPKNEQAISLAYALSIADSTGLPAKLPADMKINDLVQQVLFQKVRTLESEQQHHEAIQLLTQMWDKDRQNPAIFEHLLNGFLAAHEVTQAKEAIKEAKKRFADMPAVLENLQKQEEVIFAPTESQRYALRLAAVDKEKDAFIKAFSKAVVESDYSNSLPAGDNEKRVHAEASLKYLKDALAIKPDSREVLGVLLQQSVLDKNWNEGQTIVDKLVSLNVDGVGGKFVKGDFLLRKGEVTAKADIEAAIGLFKEGLKERPAFANAWSLLGQAYADLEQYPNAEDAYDHAIKIDPGHVAGTIGMARVKLVLLKMDEYQELIKRSYRLAPGNLWVKGKYLDLLAPTATPEQLAKYIKVCEQNLKDAPNDVENAIRLARLYEKAKQIDNAEKIYVALYKNSPNKLGAAGLLAGFYVRNKRQADADKLCTQDLLKDQNVDKAGAYMLWGGVLASMATPEGMEQAELAFNKAVELKPDDLRTQMALATFYARRPNRAKDAADVLAKYLAAQKNTSAQPEIRRQLIAYLLASSQYDQAGKMISDMLSADSTDYEARGLYGLLLLRQNKLGEAIEQFNQALAVNPSHAESLRFRGLAQLQKGDKRKALEDLGRAADINKDPNFELQLAEISVGLKDYDNAEKVLRGMLESRPDNMVILQRLAEVYMIQKEQGWTRLENLIAAGKKLSPKEPTYYQIEAQMWDLRKQPTKEIDALKVLLAMPDPVISGIAMENYLRVLQSAGQYDKMTDLIEQYRKKGDFGWLKAYEGYVAIKRNNTAKAEKLFAEAIVGASHSQVGNVLIEIELAYGPQATPAKTSQWIKQRGDNDALAWAQLALEYSRVPNIPLAQEAFQVALSKSFGEEKARISESAGRVYYEQARSQTGQKRADLLVLSEKAYLECLSLTPDNNSALNNLAYLYVEDLNQPDKALPYAQHVYILSPQSANVADTYAWVLARLKRYDEAVGILEQIIETQEGSPAFRYHLGWVYEQTSQFDKARRQYQNALDAITNDKDPLCDLLKQAIQRVKR